MIYIIYKFECGKLGGLGIGFPEAGGASFAADGEREPTGGYFYNAIDW